MRLWRLNYWELLGIPRRFHAWATAAYFVLVYAIVLALGMPIAPWNHVALGTLCVGAIAWAAMWRPGAPAK